MTDTKKEKHPFFKDKVQVTFFTYPEIRNNLNIIAKRKRTSVTAILHKLAEDFIKKNM